MPTYVDKFLSLRCAGDVLESLQPLKGDIEYQIDEAMAIIEIVRTKVMKEPGKFKIADVCSGNPFPGIIAAHLLPVEVVTNMDFSRHEKPALARVHHLRIRGGFAGAAIDRDTILISARPNLALAKMIAAAAKEHDVPLVMIPARVKAHMPRMKDWTGKNIRLDRHEWYVEHLASLAGGRSRYLPDKLYGFNDRVVTRGL